MRNESPAELFKRELQHTDLFLNESMKNHTSFKIGGPAEIFLRPRTAPDLGRALALAKDRELGLLVIGNGSNLLVPDEGIPGVVVTTTGLSAVEAEGEILTAESGAILSRVAAAALRHSLAGMEFASGIPGTLGGAIYMNAGAYGGEMKDILLESTALGPDGREYTFTNEEHHFSYRHSAYMENGYLILRAKLRLPKGEKPEIRAKMEELSKRRKEKQPVEYPSAGSVFKRPEGCFAGELIEKSGLKGARIGGAVVSEKHAGFIINDGGATADDVKKLIEKIKSEVYKNFGVEMLCEIKIL